MPEVMIAPVMQCESETDWSPLEPLIARLQDWPEAQGAQEHLAELFDGDELHMLTAMLRSAVNVWPRYSRRGISHTVYLDTMKCFSRFVQEHMESYGKTGFDRGSWATRQLSLRLFRIGELEYELVDGPFVHLHIPSDARLEQPLLYRSFREWQSFVAIQEPEWAACPILCDSWLLSPNLPHLLGADTRIIQFQQNFTLCKWEPEATGYEEWVFKLGKKRHKEVPFCDLPEETTLQRRMKRFLQEGGKIGVARGKLLPSAFSATSCDGHFD